MTDTPSTGSPIEVWIDGACAVCRRSRRWCRARDRRDRLVFYDLHVDEHPPAEREVLRRAVHVRTGDGAVVAGFEAWRRILLELDGWRWLGRLAGLPIVRKIGDLVYRVIAANRHRLAARLD